MQLFPSIDINECDDNNGGCEQNCTNTDGSFQCGCRSGFTLNEDRRTCSGKYMCFHLDWCTNVHVVYPSHLPISSLHIVHIYK